MDEEEIKEMIADFEGRNPFPLERTEQYNWWIKAISWINEIEKNNIDEKKILGISYKLLCGLLHTLDSTCLNLEKNGKMRTTDWRLFRSYKCVVQRTMEQSTEVFNGKDFELADLELRYAFTSKKYLPEDNSRLYFAVEKKRGELDG